jgi:hypothetical protein
MFPGSRQGEHLVTAGQGAAIIRPTRDGSHVQTIPSGYFGRIKKKRGSRQIIFTPGLFFKIGRNVAETDLIERERVAIQKAARYPFWAPFAGRVFRIPSCGFVGRRLRPATPDDFDRLVATVEGLFDSALAYPAIDAIEGVERRPLFRHLTRAERESLTAAIGDLAIPRTSMHGDVHVFNFVFAGNSPRLVDWEFFDANGSFVYDYLDFFISVNAINGDGNWHTIMRRLDASQPAIVAVADRLGVAPRALLAYYLFVKVNTVLSLGGSFTRVTDEFFNSIIAGLRRTLSPAA